MVKIKVSDWVGRYFFSLTIFGGNLRWCHSSVTMDGHVQALQWIGNISLLTWGLLSASVCSLEASGLNGVSLEKCVSSHVAWLLSGYGKSFGCWGGILGFLLEFSPISVLKSPTIILSYCNKSKSKLLRVVCRWLLILSLFTSQYQTSTFRRQKFTENLVQNLINLVLAFKNNWEWHKNCKTENMLEKRRYTSFKV